MKNTFCNKLKVIIWPKYYIKTINVGLPNFYMIVIEGLFGD